MIGDSEIVWMAAKVRLQSNMTSHLAGRFVTVPPQQPDEPVTGKITR